MSEKYPCRLPLPLVSGFEYQDQELAEFNDLSSGPPISRLRSDSGYSTFSARFSFSPLEKQVFTSWFRQKIKHGSKSFTIDLNIDSGVTEHTCYMRNPKYTLNGKRWSVSAQIVSTETAGLDDCDSESLVSLYSGLDNINDRLSDLEDLAENVL